MVTRNKKAAARVKSYYCNLFLYPNARLRVDGIGLERREG